MKYLILLITTTTFIFSSCNTSNNCSNGTLGNGEIEIDCGGDCDPCPQAGSLTGTFDGVPYVASSVSGYVNGNGLTIVSDGFADVDINLTFSGTEAEQYLPMQGVNYLNGTVGNHYFLFGDTGSVYLTQHDEIRKIVSGRFFFRLTGSGEFIVTDGAFENVRYTD